MIKSILLLIAAYGFILPAFSQEEYLTFSPDCKNSKYAFGKVTIIDKRPIGQTLGIVQIGAFNSQKVVQFDGNIIKGLADFFTSPTNNLIENGELVIILKEIFVSERTEAVKELGRLKLSLQIFGMVGPDKFKELFSIDTVYQFASIEVTRRLLNSVSVHMCEIAEMSEQQMLNNRFEGLRPYSFFDLYKLDSIEKVGIPVYESKWMKTGLFKNFEQFKNNSPDSCVVEIKVGGDMISVYKVDNKSKKRIKVDNNSIYAAFDGDIMIKATSMGFYKMYREKDDFFYSGETALYNSNNLVSWGAMFGVVGAIIESNIKGGRGLINFKINHLEGNSIPISINAK